MRISASLVSLVEKNVIKYVKNLGETYHARIQRGVGPVPHPWTITKPYGSLRILENHQAIQPAFNVRPSSVRQRNTI